MHVLKDEVGVAVLCCVFKFWEPTCFTFMQRDYLYKERKKKKDILVANFTVFNF